MRSQSDGVTGARVEQTGEKALFEVAEQIKHRDRVRDLAEVYTHRREVAAMLDLVPDMFPSEARNPPHRAPHRSVGHGAPARPEN